jgi:hypothetical protein
LDDTFTVLHEYDVEEFTEHITSIDPHIKFTIERHEKDSKLPFLDLCTHILDDGSTKITRPQAPVYLPHKRPSKYNHNILTKKFTLVKNCSE